MSYKHRATQLSSAAQKQRVKKHPAQKIAVAVLAVVPMIAVLGTTSILTGCGFQLRGYDTPLRFDVAKTAVIIEDNRTSFPLKLPLTRRLEALGVDVVDSMTLLENTSNPTVNNSANNTNAEQIAIITVNNVRFKRYELVGVLTEIRLALSADVSYQTVQNGQPVTLTNPIQIERSYQYNEASVSTDDQQGDQTRDWLYESLARRITDQYVALSLPKVAPASANQSSTLIKNPATAAEVTTIIAPDS
ncbi:LPS-assembly lipoprotein [Psychrobacter sp. PL15]|uniref:LPS-assembly lipoprotein LptE n=1 Tax=Psychrobacter sp. PL15 TaxID=3071719 RepID=UPI002E034853|nr:LPS-assembly lipoprotein [Psychrobacter sp. PL15]